MEKNQSWSLEANANAYVICQEYIDFIRTFQIINDKDHNQKGGNGVANLPKIPLNWNNHKRWIINFNQFFRTCYN